MGARFKRVSKAIGSGFVAVCVAICGACAAEHRIGESRNQRNSDNAMAKRFREAGWLIGRTRSADRCPKCNPAALKPAKSRPSPQPQKETPPMTGMMAAPPREPSAADRRRIREALDEHYDEAEGRYRGARSDKSVAELLNVPFKWVADLREAMGLGPDANEQATQLRTLFDETAADIEHAEKSVIEAMDRLDKAQKRMKRLELDLGYLPKAAG